MLFSDKIKTLRFDLTGIIDRGGFDNTNLVEGFLPEISLVQGVFIKKN